MIVFSRALLTGFVAGLSIGPVSAWGGQLRTRGYQEVSSVILGASVADITLGIALVELAKRFDVSPAAIEAYFEWATIPGLVIIGLALGFMAFRPASKKKWPEALRFVTAFVSTVGLPSTILFVAGCLVLGWQIDDDLHVFLPLFSAGVILAWIGNVHFFYLLKRWAAPFTGLVGAFCLLFALVQAVRLIA